MCLAVSACSENPCDNGGRCEVVGDSLRHEVHGGGGDVYFTCACEDGFVGDRCEQSECPRLDRTMLSAQSTEERDITHLCLRIVLNVIAVTE